MTYSESGMYTHLFIVLINTSESTKYQHNYLFLYSDRKKRKNGLLHQQIGLLGLVYLTVLVIHDCT